MIFRLRRYDNPIYDSPISHAWRRGDPYPGDAHRNLRAPIRLPCPRPVLLALCIFVPWRFYVVVVTDNRTTDRLGKVEIQQVENTMSIVLLSQVVHVSIVRTR